MLFPEIIQLSQQLQENTEAPRKLVPFHSVAQKALLSKILGRANTVK